MCGICGVVDKRGRLAPVPEMNRIQRHRGPDDEGYLYANTLTGRGLAMAGPDTMSGIQLPEVDSASSSEFDLAFGSRRLAIIDPTTDGHQPMQYRRGSLWITYNGEIYNYIELREELRNLGHRFVTQTDTEVILAAYAEWGTGCLQHLNGMFAFAVWDSPNRQVFCARDRFGIKPFYYFWDGSLFVFASELKAVLRHSAIERNPNDEAIFDYLVLGVSDHSERTFFDGVTSIGPGEFLVLDLETYKLSQNRWWDVSVNPNFEEGADRMPDVYDHFEELLRDSVALRLRSDVPIGSCLSGGLDSSALVCLANSLLLNEAIVPRRLVGLHQKTFTARYHESAIDEHEYSSTVIRHTGAEENIVFPSADGLWRDLESFVWHMDEPVNSTSQYAQWSVMRLARDREVTVLLDGQGGDEILAGYYSYFPKYVKEVSDLRGKSRSAMVALQMARVQGLPFIRDLFREASHELPWHVQRAIRAIWRPKPSPGSALQEWQLAGNFLERFSTKQWRPSSETQFSRLADVLHRDLTSTNLPKLLRYEDRNSMAFSREARLPFLDYRLVEFVFSLPLQYRISNGWSKWILRKSMEGILPERVRWRRSKFGFPTPQEEWFLFGTRNIRSLLGSFDSDWLSTYIAPSVIDRIRCLPDSELATTPGLWRLLNLGMWFDNFFRRSDADALQNLSQSSLPIAQSRGDIHQMHMASTVP
ncbi:MAG: asparagine synthase (glutamine-hydrolyzing) [Anaerolineales bacterium]